MAGLGHNVCRATEGSASVYPAGVETVLPGLYPSAGESLLAEFNTFYNANVIAGPNGRSEVPGFHLRVGAMAVKVVHNWGVPLLGGTLVNAVAAPLVDTHISAPFGNENRVGVGNPNIETAVVYKTGALHWWYGFEVYTPGFAYTKHALVNIGQHHYASAPAAAFTYLPTTGLELSSKVQYIFNYSDGETHFRSGNELIWEYAALHSVTKPLALGVNGFYYQQTTNDLQNDLLYRDGNRGRTFGFGPEVRVHFKHEVVALKYQKEFFTQNRPSGNVLWLQFGVPLGRRE